MSKREQGSVVLAFAGFAVLVLAFRGTWGHAWHALFSGSGKSSGASGSTAAASGQLAYPVSAGTLAFAGVTSGRPGQAPTPLTAVQAQRPERGGGGSNVHSLAGDPTGEAGTVNVQRVTSQSQLDTSGGWGVTWTGPGTYQSKKFTGRGGSDTRWVKVG